MDIIGYRALNDEEKALINKIKLHELATEKLLHMVGEHLRNQVTNSSPEDLERLSKAQPERWLAMAKTDMQTAGMCLVRAVAQPTSF